MKCLDTDFLVAVLRGAEDVKLTLDKFEEEGIQYTTSINAFELYFGAFLSGKKENNLKAVEALLSRLHVIQFDIEDAKVAGQIASGLKEKGEKLDFRDVLIASAAISGNLPIVTRNVEHFSRIEGLKVLDW